MIAMGKSMRFNAETARRMDNMQRVVESLRKKPMSINDVVILLGYSKSGARSYLTELARLKIVRVDPMQINAARPPVGLYHLVSEQLADEFLKLVQLVRAGVAARPAKVPDMAPDGSARVHFAGERRTILVNARPCPVSSDPITDAIFMRKRNDA